MMHFLMTHAADIFGATLVFGPIVLGTVLAIVSRTPRGSRRTRMDGPTFGRSSLKVTRRELETAGQPWLRTYDAHMRPEAAREQRLGATGYAPQRHIDARDGKQI